MQMRALTEYIAKAIVDQPEDVLVDEIRHGSHVNLDLHVAKEDMGRVIGRGGRVATAIRMLLRVAAEREGCQVTLEVVEQ
jgi:predicted RNA-binding protein YlqC (UPF0109 family)